MSETNTQCILPWIHLHTWPNNTVYPCCMTPQDQPAGSLDTHSLREIFNSEQMRTMRLEMMQGLEPSACTRCFEQERAGQFSMRNDVNKRFAHHTDIIETTQIDGTVDEMRMPYWDFRFSNICNFKCRSCGPQLSTGWYDDHKRLSNGTLPPGCPDPDRPMTMWEQIEPLFDSVEEIYFAGGEPLIMEEHYRILNHLIELGRTDVKLRYNTNFSRMRYKSLDVIDAWRHFPHVKIDASLDGMGAQAEYIRKGTTWQNILDNRERLRSQAPHVWFGINCTTSIQNALHVSDFWQWCAESGFIDNPNNFHVNLVQDPEWLRLDALPDTVKYRVTQAYTQARQRAIDIGAESVARDFQGAIDYMNSTDRSHLLATFRQRMTQLDTLRGESFAEVFPELGEFMCE